MKYWRRYILAATAVVSLTFAAAGIVAVDECARRISLGERQNVVAFGGEAVIREPARVFVI